MRKLVHKVQRIKHCLCNGEPITFLVKAEYSIRSDVSNQSFLTAGLESAARVSESLKTLREDFKMISWLNMKKNIYTNVGGGPVSPTDPEIRAPVRKTYRCTVCNMLSHH